VFFYIYTRSMPKFGVSWSYAYAGAPEWYLPRHQHFVTGLAPFVVMTLAGITLIPILPADWASIIVLFTALNGSACIGDFTAAVWLLRCSPQALVNDTGDEITFYDIV